MNIFEPQPLSAHNDIYFLVHLRGKLDDVCDGLEEWLFFFPNKIGILPIRTILISSWNFINVVIPNIFLVPLIYG